MFTTFFVKDCPFLLLFFLFLLVISCFLVVVFASSRCAVWNIYQKASCNDNYSIVRQFGGCTMSYPYGLLPVHVGCQDGMRPVAIPGRRRKRMASGPRLVVLKAGMGVGSELNHVCRVLALSVPCFGQCGRNRVLRFDGLRRV
ncbi:hypothetical protein LX36DRAFT_289713 [Colletotrichum falcatum]|nr:hypothetical protein LX36DRAFT_289713 [Colletotrichum falcatum]